jgi:superfamily I DNA/RNA helicase
VNGFRSVSAACRRDRKGLESPVVVLCEIDERVEEADLAGLLYVGATRARSHLVVVAGESVASRFAV